MYACDVQQSASERACDATVTGAEHLKLLDENQGWVGKTFYTVLTSFTYLFPIMAWVKLGKTFG